MITGMLELFPGHLKYMATREYLVRGKRLGAVNEVKKERKNGAQAMITGIPDLFILYNVLRLVLSHTRLFETP